MQFKDSELYHLHEIVLRLDQIARREILSDMNLTYNEFLIMMIVRETGTLSQQEAADALDVSKSLMSQRVSALVAKGMILQVPAKNNRREQILDLSPEGRAQIERAYSALSGSAEELFSSLGTERAAFNEALVKIVDGLNRIEERFASNGSPGRGGKS